MKTAGQIIREKRELKGLLLRHVAAYLDIDQAILSRIERGERKPSRDNIVRLSQILEISEHELLIQFMSDNIANDFVNESCAKETLRLAEKKIQYLKEKLIK